MYQSFARRKLYAKVISKRLNISTSAVCRFLKYGVNKPTKRRNCKGVRKTTNRSDNVLKRLCLKNRELISNELRREFFESTGIEITASIIRKKLIKFGLFSRRKTKKPFLNKRQRGARVPWCNNYKDRPKEFWENVLFSPTRAKFNWIFMAENKGCEDL